MAEIIKTTIDVDINTSAAAAELRNLQQKINAFNLTLNKSQLAQGQAAAVWAEGITNAVNSTGMFRAETVKMRTAASALDATLRKGQATLGQFFSAAFSKRSSIAAETFALAAERARTMQTQFIATGKAAKGMQDAIAIRPLTAFSSAAAISSQRLDILNSMFRQGTTQLINFGKNVQWAGRQLMVGFTVPLTIFGTTAGKVFKDLEMQAVAFKKVYGDIFTTPAEMQDNLKAVQGLAKEFTKYGIAAKDTMSLAAQAAAAGRRNSDLTDAVTESTRLATLGQMDQNSALETTIALQSAFKLSGKELADTINFLNMVENQTVVSLQDIASAIPRVAPVIQGLGGDVKDLTVFLAAMQEGGVSAEQGANALKSGLGSLINPTKSATEELGKLGININSIIQTNQGDLMGIITSFSEALSVLGEFQQQQVLETLFGKYQYARLGALFENISRDGSQAQQVIASMGYSTQDLAKTAEKELNTVRQAFSVQLIGAVERFKLAIAPIGEIFVRMAIPIVNWLTKIAEWFNSLPEGVRNITAIATAITGVLIPAGTMMFGLFANLIGTLAKMGGSITLFGVTLLRKGPLAAIQSLTQSSKYLSIAEIDAANAAMQLGSATQISNQAMLETIGAASNSTAAIDRLSGAYQRLAAEQLRASQTQPFLFSTGQAAANIAGEAPKIRPKARIKGIGLNSGGKVYTLNDGNTVPGTGNTDTVPAMLTPGEFVVNKEATKNNLGLLHAINAQKLNMGGGVSEFGRMFYGRMPSSVSEAAENFIIGSIPGFSAKTNKMAAKLVGSQTARKSRPANVGIAGEVLGKLNNFVYLLRDKINYQLNGTRRIKEFDKRGVPFDVMKNEMLTDDALWMIDSYAGGPWNKEKFKEVLLQNFDDISAKYPGKDIRFLDSKGIDRVQKFINTPGYENVQFVSVKDLNNNKLFSTLSKDHLDALQKESTQNVMEMRKTSRGGERPRSTYKAIPGMDSFTKKQKNWRGEPKPTDQSGRPYHGAHMYNDGGEVETALKKTFATGKGPANRLHFTRPTGIALDKYIESIWSNSALDSQKRVKLLEKNGIPKKISKTIAKIKDPKKAAQILREKNFGFYVGGFAGGTSAISNRQYNMFTEYLRQISDPPIGEGMSGPKELKNLTKNIPPYILEGSLPLTQTDLTNVLNEFQKIKDPELLGSMYKDYDKMLKGLGKFKKLSPKQYQQAIMQRMKGVQGAAGGNLKNIDWIFKNLPKNYTADDVLNKIYSIVNPSFRNKETKGQFAPKNAKFEIGKFKNPVAIKTIFEKLLKMRKGYLPMVAYMFNKGGKVPGVQYANAGKMIAALYKSKPRNSEIDELRYLSEDVRNKILNKEVNKRGDFFYRADKNRFDIEVSRYVGKRASKDDLLDVLTADYSKLLSNEALFKVAKNKNTDDDVLNVLATQFKGRLKKANPEMNISYLEQTAKIIRDRGIKLNKGGMIPGVQYAMSGKLIKDAMGRGRLGEKLGQFNPRTIEAVTEFIQSGDIASIRSGADRKLLANLIPAFKRSKQAQTLERALFYPRKVKPGETLNLGSLQSFSPKGVGVGQHLKGNPIMGKMDLNYYFYNVRKKQLEYWENALKEKKNGTYRGLDSMDEIQKNVNENRKDMLHYKKEFDTLEANNIPTVIELKTPSGTMMIDVDTIVSKEAQTYLGKPINEQERILHNASLKVTGVKDEKGIQRIFAELIGAEKLKLNKGNIVPGTGNTDTVPAMLTPGEFVVNKEATQQNLDLLHAINNGSLPGLNKGGQIPGMQYFSPGGIAEFMGKIGSKLSNTIRPSLLPKREYNKLISSIYKRENIRVPGQYGEDLIPTYQINGSSFAFQGVGDDFSQLTSKGIIPIKTNPQSLLEAAIKLNPRDKKLQTMLENIKNKKFGPAETRLLDEIGASVSIGRRGKVSVEESVDGFAMVLASLSGNKNAQRIVNEKTGAYFKEFQRRKIQSVKYNSKDFEDLTAIHSTKFPVTRDANGNITLQPYGYHNMGTDMSVPRASLHFTLEAPVKQQGVEGVWNSSESKIISKLSSIVDKNGLPSKLNPIDTWWMRSPGQGLKLSNASVIRSFTGKNKYTSELINRGLISSGQKSPIMVVDPKTNDVLYLLKKDYSPSERLQISEVSKDLKLTSFMSSKNPTQIIDPSNPKSFIGFEDELLERVSMQVAKKQLGINNSPFAMIDGWQINNRQKTELAKFLSEKYSIEGGIHSGSSQALLESAFNTTDDITKQTKFFGNSIEGMRMATATGNFGKNRIPAKSTVILNSGNIVPGVGDTDTVPAMLTPGEFVVNKKATQQNLDLLHSINNGTIAGLNKGGGVAQTGRRFYGEKQLPESKIKAGGGPGSTTVGATTGAAKSLVRGGGAVGMAAGLLASTPVFGMTEQLGTFGSMAAGMVAWSAAQKGATAIFNKITGNSKILAEAAKASGTAVKGMNLKALMLTRVLGMAAGGWITLGIGIVTLGIVIAKLSNNIKESGQKFSKAMYGSSDRINEMANAMGRTTASQQMIQQQAELIAGQRSSAETMQMSTAFMKTQAGTQLLTDVKTVKKFGGDATEALKNQLGQAILSGIMTPEEARQIAIDIGIALKDQKLAVQVSGKLSELFGPNGERIKDNRIQIMTQLMAPTDIKDVAKQTDAAFQKIQSAALNPFLKGYNFGDALQNLVSKTNPEYYKQQMQQSALQENIIQNALREKEIRSQINLEYQQGLITFSKYKDEISLLNRNQFGSEQIQEYVKQFEGLKVSARAGATGSENPVMSIYRNALLTLQGSQREINVPTATGLPITATSRSKVLQDQRNKIMEGEDAYNKIRGAFMKELSNLGFDEKQQQELLDFIDTDVGNSFEDQAVLMGKVLSGELSAAALVWGQELGKQTKDAIRKNTGLSVTQASETISPLVGTGLETTAQNILSGKQQGAQQGSMTDIEYVKKLAERYQELAALPPELVKELKIDLNDENDVMTNAPRTEKFINNYRLLDQLPSSINKNTFFKYNALDENGNPIDESKFASKIKEIGKQFNKLDSGDKKIRKEAEIAIYKTVNNDQTNAEAAIEQARKDVEDFDKLPKEIKTTILLAYATVGQTQLDFALEMQKWKGNMPKEEREAWNQKIKAEQNSLNQTINSANATVTDENGQKSQSQEFAKTYKELTKNAQAFYSMIGTGKNKVDIESASLLEQNGLLGINANKRKEVIKQIKNSTAITAALNYLRKSDEEKAIERANNQIRILQRQNELDQRKIAIRQRGLDEISKKEEQINKAYDARVTALDAVAQMNQRLEQQRQSRITLAGALVSGDIGAAASAASSMAASFAQYQTEDARAALEKSRADAIAAVQVSINGTLMTRQQIMDSIELIQKDMYDRDLLIQDQQDLIYQNEEALRAKEEERIETGIKLLSSAKNIKKKTDEALAAAIEYTKQLAAPVEKTITVTYVYKTSGQPSGNGTAFGGQFATGGMYTGSKEPPPPMKMVMGGRYKKYQEGGFATGSGGLIPGLGNVDNFNALLMPGEYVVRKNATKAFKPLLDAMNYNVFPNMDDLIKVNDIPSNTGVSNNNVITNNTPVYNSYNVSLNVPNSNASSEDIANAVAVQLRRISNNNIKGIAR